MPNAHLTSLPRTMTIELLALDLGTCGRCTGTSTNMDAAIAAVADVMREADVNIEVRKTVVTTAGQAEQLRFESSPTIRINGRDIALELRESNCNDCADLCGCDGQIDCRVWVWQGREHVEAPKAMIIDAILRAYSHAWEPLPSQKTPFSLPENLRKFFDAGAQTAAHSVNAANNVEACCDRTRCCDESEREACCGSDGVSPHSSQTCGCRS